MNFINYKKGDIIKLKTIEQLLKEFNAESIFGLGYPSVVGSMVKYFGTYITIDSDIECSFRGEAFMAREGYWFNTEWIDNYLSLLIDEKLFII